MEFSTTLAAMPAPSPLPPDCMADVARRMSPDDIVAVSAYLASQPVPSDARPVAALPGPMPLECGGVAAAGR